MSSYCVKRIYVVTFHLVVVFRVENAIQQKVVLNQLMHKFILDTITDQHFDCVRCVSSEERKLTSIRQVRVLWYARDVLLPLQKRAMRFINSSGVQKLVDPYLKKFEFSRSTACVSLVHCFHWNLEQFWSRKGPAWTHSSLCIGVASVKLRKDVLQLQLTCSTSCRKEWEI